MPDQPPAVAFTPADVLYCAMPLFHGNALLANLTDDAPFTTTRAPTTSPEPLIARAAAIVEPGGAPRSDMPTPGFQMNARLAGPLSASAVPTIQPDALIPHAA